MRSRCWLCSDFTLPHWSLYRTSGATLCKRPSSFEEHWAQKALLFLSALCFDSCSSLLSVLKVFGCGTVNLPGCSPLIVFSFYFLQVTLGKTMLLISSLFCEPKKPYTWPMSVRVLMVASQQCVSSMNNLFRDKCKLK